MNDRRLTRADYAECVAMIFDSTGNALGVIDYTPEALEREARRLREELGELTVVTYGPSQFVMHANGGAL